MSARFTPGVLPFPLSPLKFAVPFEPVIVPVPQRANDKPSIEITHFKTRKISLDVPVNQDVDLFARHQHPVQQFVFFDHFDEGQRPAIADDGRIDLEGDQFLFMN